MTTQTCVLPDGFRVQYLCSEVMRGNEVLYTIRLFPIFTHEQRLTSGRFQNYTPDALEYKATIHIDTTKPLPTYACVDYTSFNALVQKHMEWCAEMTTEIGGKWSFEVEPQSVHRISIHYTFDNATTAVSFKLLSS